MPKLLIFAPCDNVLFSGGADTISLITIMTTVALPTPLDNFAPGTLVPMRWFIFCNWATFEEDQGKIFEQRIRLVQDDDTLFDSIQVMEIQTGKTHHRMVAGVNVFPIIKAGKCELKLSLRELDTEIWEDISTYPLLIQHL